MVAAKRPEDIKYGVTPVSVVPATSAGEKTSRSNITGPTWTAESDKRNTQACSRRDGNGGAEVQHQAFFWFDYY